MRHFAKILCVIAIFVISNCQRDPIVNSKSAQKSVSQSSRQEKNVKSKTKKTQVIVNRYSRIKAGDTVKKEGILDAQDPTASLQEPGIALIDFPRDVKIDWIKALNLGLLKPRADLTGENKLTSIHLDIIMKNTKGTPFVRFSHSVHTKVLECSNCHPKLFIPRKGGNKPISMKEIRNGEKCGYCHGKVSFSLDKCERCHSVLQAKFW